MQTPITPCYNCGYFKSEIMSCRLCHGTPGTQCPSCRTLCNTCFTVVSQLTGSPLCPGCLRPHNEFIDLFEDPPVTNPKIPCQICFQREANAVFTHCNHLVMCSACYNKSKSKQCPYCRQVNPDGAIRVINCVPPTEA